MTATTSTLPLWPLLILALLIALGVRQSRDRLVQPKTLVRLAVVMLALSLYGVASAFGAQALPLLAWAAGLSAVLVLGRRALAPRILAREGAAVRLQGSCLPLALMLGIFADKFVLGFATGVGSPVVHEAWFVAVASLSFGLFSGAFAARAAAVQRVVSAAAA
ncbi:MAG: hypothetical protein K9J82_09055 [Methylotenera sp.]|jgi:hypothetical protein|nr:hypothetical protein [Methylotenera sp.]